MKLYNLITEVLDFLFPSKCIECGKNGEFACGDCLAKEMNQESRIKNHAEKVIYAFSYHRKLVREAILGLKYKNKKDMAKIFARFLYDILLPELEDLKEMENFRDPIVIPIPLHKKKLNKRGYNQAELIVKELAKLDEEKNFKVETGVLKRIMVTAHHEPQMPIVILTANATTEARRECEEARIDAFLTKPIDAITLLDTVARLTATRNNADSTELATALIEPATKGDGALLNENTLRRLKLLDEGGDFVDTVIQGFISEGEQLLEAMGAMLLKHEYVIFKELAHTLKGSAGNIGADALFQICREISRLNHSDLQASASNLLGKAQGSFSASRQAMIRYLETS